jgi:hypothetical protein
MTRRRLQIALGLLWLLDGALQLQPFMWGAGFAWQVIEPTATGQPHVLAAAVRWGANVIAAHPLTWDLLFAGTQLAIGLGLLVPRTSRLALVASLPWSAGVWSFGEGLSGLAGGDGSLLTGAPGAAFLYGLLAVAAWPQRDGRDEPPARWLPIAWAVLWVGGAVFEALAGDPLGKTVALVSAEASIGITALRSRSRPLAATAGLVLALGIWVIDQDFGGLFTGQATDPNTGPLFALMALALFAPARGKPMSVGLARVQPHRGTAPRRAPPLWHVRAVAEHHARLHA